MAGLIVLIVLLSSFGVMAQTNLIYIIYTSQTNDKINAITFLTDMALGYHNIKEVNSLCFGDGSCFYSAGTTCINVEGYDDGTYIWYNISNTTTYPQEVITIC